MRHLQAFFAEEVESKNRLGTIEICELKSPSDRYAYYFRNMSGEYTQLVMLESRSVQECREFEEKYLKDYINQHIATLNTKEWKIYRTRPTIWDDASKISPEITNYLFLESKAYLFEDDDEEKDKEE